MATYVLPIDQRTIGEDKAALSDILNFIVDPGDPVSVVSDSDGHGGQAIHFDYSGAANTMLASFPGAPADVPVGEIFMQFRGNTGLKSDWATGPAHHINATNVDAVAGHGTTAGAENFNTSVCIIQANAGYTTPIGEGAQFSASTLDTAGDYLNVLMQWNDDGSTINIKNWMWASSATEPAGDVDVNDATLVGASGPVGITRQDGGDGDFNLLYVSVGTGTDSAPRPSASSDTTAPTFTAGPTAANVADTSLDINATLDEAGTIYSVVVADAATAPSSAQVKAGQDSTGAAAISAGSVAAAASTQATISHTGLTASTAYDVYTVAEDDEATANVQASPTLVNATTTAAVAAPNLTNPIGTSTGETTADGSVDTDQSSGTLYWVATQSITKPSVAQVKAGQDHNGAAADASGSQAVTATGTQNVSATGLAAGTTYYFHFQHNIPA